MGGEQLGLLLSGAPPDDACLACRACACLTRCSGPTVLPALLQIAGPGAGALGWRGVWRPAWGLSVAALHCKAAHEQALYWVSKGAGGVSGKKEGLCTADRTFAPCSWMR